MLTRLASRMGKVAFSLFPELSWQSLPRPAHLSIFAWKHWTYLPRFPGSQTFQGKKKRDPKKSRKNKGEKSCLMTHLFVKKKLLGFPGCCVLHFSRLRKPHSTTTVPVRSKGSVANGIPPSFDHWTPHQHLRCDFAMTEIDRGWLGICLGIWWNPSPFFLGRCVLAGGNLEGIFLKMACIVQIPSYNREQFGATH